MTLVLRWIIYGLLPSINGQLILHMIGNTF